MVCTYVRAISKVSIKGEVKMDILHEAVKLLDGYYALNILGNGYDVALKDEWVRITVTKEGLEVAGRSQEQVKKQIAMLYQAKAQEAILRRMGYQTKVEKQKKKIRILAVR